MAGTGIPVWVRDEWSASEKSMVDAARSAGSDSPVIYVFIPRLSAEDLRRWVIEAAAAEQTIESKGVPATPEGAEAKRSMESRLALAVKNRDSLVRDIVGSAKVFQGGGTEMLQLTLDAKLRDAITSSLARLFPRFGEADSAAWKVAMQKARDGADQPFGPVGHSGATEQHSVCQEVLSRIGAGKTGTALRKELEAAPFGWPRDAVDAAFIALHRSQHLRVTLNGALVVPGQLDQNKIPKAEFRVDSAPLPVGDRLLVRGLIATLVPCKNGEELAKAPEFLLAIQSLAASAGGPAPRPAPPAVPGIDELKGLSGNAASGWHPWRRRLVEAPHPRLAEGSRLVRPTLRSVGCRSGACAARDRIAGGRRRSGATGSNSVEQIASRRGGSRRARSSGVDSPVTTESHER